MSIKIKKENSEDKLKNDIQKFVNKSITGLRHKKVNADQFKIKDALREFKLAGKSCEDLSCELLYTIEYCKLNKTVNPIKKANYYLKSAFLNELFGHDKKYVKNDADKACGLIINALKNEQNIKSKNNLRLFANSVINRFKLQKYLIETLKDEETYNLKNLIRQ